MRTKSIGSIIRALNMRECYARVGPDKYRLKRKFDTPEEASKFVVTGKHVYKCTRCNFYHVGKGKDEDE